MSGTLPFAVPDGLARNAVLGERWTAWLDTLPRTTARLVDEWELSYDGPPWHGFCSLVVPVRTVSGRPAALKVAFPGDENEHEHLALQHWQGRGAVTLLRADPRRYALLLERLHPEDLTDVWDVQACELVAALYERLHVPAPPQLRTLTSYLDRWVDDLAALPPDAPLPRRLVEQAVALGRDFVTDPDSTGTLVHTDLHYENVLAADREPWLVIDPKPVSGDRHYEVAPLLWNRWPELVDAGRVRDGVRDRFHAVVDAAGLAEDRARDWVVTRAVVNASWTLGDAARLGRGLHAEDRDWLTRMVTAAKAVQD